MLVAPLAKDRAARRASGLHVENVGTLYSRTHQCRCSVTTRSQGSPSHDHRTYHSSTCQARYDCRCSMSVSSVNFFLSIGIAVRRTASTSTIASSPATPTTEISHLAIATPPPTPPTSLLSLHARARALLRSTCNNANTEIAGRDEERATIHDFLSSFLDNTVIETDDGPFTSLYISGTPGTGKTALVNTIIRSLSTDAKVISINCMALNSVEALWDRLVEELEDGKKRKTAGRTKKVKGRDAVESILSKHYTKWSVSFSSLDKASPPNSSSAL